MYDYLIVGTGVFGSVFAHEAHQKGKKVLVIDKRNQIGGNAYTEKIENIDVHRYGAHIFHTSNRNVWDYVNRFAAFNHYVNSPIAIYQGELYNLPFNMNTFSKMWGITTPQQAKDRIEKQRCASGVVNPKNLEEQALFLVGKDIYEKLIKGYTEKQWGQDCRDLPTEIIKRLPLRFTYDNNYFSDPYQGIPIGGYTQMFENMLKGIEVKLNCDFLQERRSLTALANKVVYTGMIDAYYDYVFGALAYRSLRFETKTLDTSNFQGNAVVNYTDREVPYTRIIEHKHFDFGSQQKTVVTYEYPLKKDRSNEPYYPVFDAHNRLLYAKYHELAQADRKVVFGGRLGTYSYLDMDKTVLAALEAAKQIL